MSENLTIIMQDDSDGDLESVEGNQLENVLTALKAKQRASILWLLSKACDCVIPPELKEPFYKDHGGEERLKPQIQRALADGELYCLALANIYADPNYNNLNHTGILTVLMRKGIYVQEPQENALTESVLSRTNPIKMSAHMVIIDALMSLYIKEVLIPEKVIEVVDRFSPIDYETEELPEEAEDAALFWLNKSCQKLCERISEELATLTPTSDRDRNRDPHSRIPHIAPLEYLWDLSDGCSLAALLTFYCPSALNWREIFFNEPMSTNDAVYNLQLVEIFCQSHLPSDVFFLSVVDLFDCHRLVRQNVLAFVADLLYHFEIKPADCVQTPVSDYNPLLSEDENYYFHRQNGKKASMTWTRRMSPARSLSSMTFNHSNGSAKRGTNRSLSSDHADDEDMTRYFTALDLDASVESSPESILLPKLDKQQQQQQQQHPLQQHQRHESLSSLHAAAAAATHTPIQTTTPAPASMSSHVEVTKNGTDRSMTPDKQQQQQAASEAHVPNHTLSHSCESREELSPGVGFVIGDGLGEPNRMSELSMAKKKELIMQQSIKRKAEQEARRIKLQEEQARKREEDRKRTEEAERKREEERMRKQKILEEYRMKKAADDDEKSIKSSSYSGGRDLKNNTVVLNRPNRGAAAGSAKHRPKSIHVNSSLVQDYLRLDPQVSRVTDSVDSTSRQMASQHSMHFATPSHNSMRSSDHSLSLSHDNSSSSHHLSPLSRPAVPLSSTGSSRAGSVLSSSSRMLSSPPSTSALSVTMPTMPPLYQRNRGPSSDGASDVGSAFSEYTGPKLFVKPTQKSNRTIILNAVNIVLAGSVNADLKKKVIEEIGRSDSKHFLLLFRGAGLQFRAIYSYCPESEEVIKLLGTGPKNVDNQMIDKFYKYNSGSKNFVVVHTKHLSITIDAFTIHNSLWPSGRPAGLRRPVSMIVSSK